LKTSEESAQASAPIPPNIIDVLKTTGIGILSVTSKKGDLYSYPVAFHYGDQKIYMITPIGSAKMKLIKANPKVSFIVDNRKFTIDCCGAMFQGSAKVFSMAKLITSFVTRGPMAQFSKKYPGYMSFYLKGKDLPSERKFYKYRLIRIDPTKIVYWTGYKFGKFIPPKSKSKEPAAELLDPNNPEKVEHIAGLLNSADEEPEIDELPRSEDWLSELKSAVKGGVMSEDERRLISSFRIPQENAIPAGKVTDSEKTMLKKWKAIKS
jgi:general stress protein 26